MTELPFKLLKWSPLHYFTVFFLLFFMKDYFNSEHSYSYLRFLNTVSNYSILFIYSINYFYREPSSNFVVMIGPHPPSSSQNSFHFIFFNQEQCPFWWHKNWNYRQFLKDFINLLSHFFQKSGFSIFKHWKVDVKFWDKKVLFVSFDGKYVYFGIICLVYFTSD